MRNVELAESKKVRTTVLLKPEVRAKLDEKAEQFGMSTSAYLTFIIGQHLAQAEAMKPMLDKLVDAMPDAFMKALPKSEKG